MTKIKNKKRRVQWTVPPLKPGEWLWTAGTVGRVVAVELPFVRYQWLQKDGELSSETRRMRTNRIIGTPPLDCIPRQYHADLEGNWRYAA